MSDSPAPVLVVGAGPVGLTMAMALRRRGVDVRIIDRNAAGTDKSKALVLWPRTLELLDIQGCAKPFIDAGHQARGATIVADGKQLLQVRLSIAPSAYAYALMLPQSDTERLLEVELGKLGVQVERNTELLSFEDGGDAGVSCIVRDAAGIESTFQCAWLAGCDGAHSTARHALGMEFDGDTLPSDWLLADVLIDGPLDADELRICLAPAGVMAFFPIAGRRFRIITEVGASAADVDGAVSTPGIATIPGAGSEPGLDVVQALVDARGPPGLRVHDAVWTSHFRINERKVADYSRGRVFLCGDAAHVHSPAGGQGMNTGMQDALNLAWKLALVWHGQAEPALLDSYSPERSAIGDQVLRNAGNLTRAATLRNPILRELRNFAAGTVGHLPAVQQKLVAQLTELDLHYPRSPLTRTPHGAARQPAGGDRALDVALVSQLPGPGAPADMDDATAATDTADAAYPSLHAVLATGRFAVLSVGAPLVALPSDLQSLAIAIAVAAAPGYDDGHAYLVRPDAYIAMSTPGSDATAILVALGELVVRTPTE